MRIIERQAGDVTILDLHGELLIGEGDQALEDAVAKLGDGWLTKVLLNVADVPHVDCAGIGAIVRSYKTVSRKNGGLKLLNPTKKILSELSITKLLTIFEIYDDEAQAVLSFDPKNGHRAREMIIPDEYKFEPPPPMPPPQAKRPRGFLRRLFGLN